MKKTFLFLSLVCAFAFNAQAFTTTISSASAPKFYCYASEPFWLEDGVTCCCNIYCVKNGGVVGTFMPCVSWSGAFLAPGQMPFNVSTYFEFTPGVSMSNPNPTQADLTEFQNFKTNGIYNVTIDSQHTDTQGNVTIIKAGTYQIVNGKIGVFAIRTQS